MSEHRVATHLGLAATDYDREIRRMIPGYEEMLREVVALLDDVLDSDPLVCDLGAGTGALAGAILDGIPRARALLVDIDPNMLEVAMTRLAPHASRVEVRRQQFADPLPPCDAIVASLALHHVANVDDKRALYRQLRGALEPGGVLLSADAVVHSAGPEHDRVFRVWTAGMFDHDIGPGEAEALFAQWSTEDTYQPLSVELALLADAGFRRPECFWRRGPLAVFGGFA
jgi:tRNA (cmo5U34)-methyltransferase